MRKAGADPKPSSRRSNAPAQSHDHDHDPDSSRRPHSIRVSSARVSEVLGYLRILAFERGWDDDDKLLDHINYLRIQIGEPPLYLQRTKDGRVIARAMETKQ